MCHGENGDGQSRAMQGLVPPPRDFTQPHLADVLDRDHMIASVTQGIAGTAMTAWSRRLDTDEIARVVDYIRQRWMADSGENATAQVAAHDNEHGMIHARADPDTWQRGQRIYAESCSVCHGDQGAGAEWGRQSLQPPPRDFTTAEASAVLSRERMAASVRHGRPGTAMTAWHSRLSDDDIEAVVDYIRVAFMNVDVEETDDAETPMPFGLQGDVQSGQAFYLSNCAECHGVEGRGNGPRAYFILPRPRDFTHPSVRGSYDRARLFHGTRDGVAGREMPAWGKVLDDQAIANVAEYVYRTFVHPDAGQ